MFYTLFVVDLLRKKGALTEELNDAEREREEEREEGNNEPTIRNICKILSGSNQLAKAYFVHDTMGDTRMVMFIGLQTLERSHLLQKSIV